MGGKYKSEYGLVEPDVGYETLHEKVALKQWCKLGHLEGLPDDFTIFRTKGEVEFQSEIFKPTEGIEFSGWNFEEHYEPDKKRMCFRSKLPKLKPEFLPGAIYVCVETYPKEKPTSAWIGFPIYYMWTDEWW